MSTTNKIKVLEQKRGVLVDKLIQEQPLMRGTFGKTFRRCGTSTCGCVEGPGHPYIRITWTEQARSRTKAIPETDVAWVKTVTQNYRTFRRIRRRVRLLEGKFKFLLDRLENERIKKTKRLKGYA